MALAILVIGVIGVMRLVPVAMRVSKRSEVFSKLAIFAQKKLEEVKLAGFDKISQDPPLIETEGKDAVLFDIEVSGQTARLYRKKSGFHKARAKEERGHSLHKTGAEGLERHKDDFRMGRARAGPVSARRLCVVRRPDQLYFRGRIYLRRKEVQVPLARGRPPYGEGDSQVPRCDLARDADGARPASS